MDPVLAPEQSQSLNGYGYGGNNPATNSDPAGLYYPDPEGGGGGGGSKPAPPRGPNGEDRWERREEQKERARKARRPHRPNGEDRWERRETQKELVHEALWVRRMDETQRLRASRPKDKSCHGLGCAIDIAWHAQFFINPLSGMADAVLLGNGINTTPDYVTLGGSYCLPFGFCPGANATLTRNGQYTGGLGGGVGSPGGEVALRGGWLTSPHESHEVDPNIQEWSRSAGVTTPFGRGGPSVAVTQFGFPGETRTPVAAEVGVGAANGLSASYDVSYSWAGIPGYPPPGSGGGSW